MSRLLVFFMACLFILMAASGAFAQQVDNPCAEDIAKYCGNIQPGKGYIAECLSQNEEKLSPKCKSIHLRELSEVLRQTDQACQTDSTRYCGAESVQGGIKLLLCLRRQASLEPECKKKLFEALELMRY